LDDHLGGNLFDVIVCNNAYSGGLPSGSQWVKLDEGLEKKYPIYQAGLIDPGFPWHHDAGKLSQVLIDLLEKRKLPLVK
jgi:hypothetical protein